MLQGISEEDTEFSERGGVGCREYGYFILGHFVAGTYHAVHRQNVGSQNTGGQNASRTCKGGQNAGPFMGQGGQNANLFKILYMSC